MMSRQPQQSKRSTRKQELHGCADGAQKRRAYKLRSIEEQQNQIDRVAAMTMPPDTTARRKTVSPGEGCFAKHIISLNANLAKYRGAVQKKKRAVENPSAAWKTVPHDYAAIYKACTICILHLLSDLYRFVKN